MPIDAWRRAVERQFLAAIADGAEIVETPAFRVHLWPRPEPFYRSVAAPIRQSAHWPTAIEAMSAVFAAAARPARLEFIAERWPSLGPALAAAGFAAFPTAVVMARRAGPIATSPMPGLRRLSADDPPSLLRAFLEGVNAASGPALDVGTADAEVAKLAADLAAGRALVTIVEEAAAPAAGAGVIGVARDPKRGPTAGELAAVWTAPRLRGLGLAAIVCRHVLARFFAEGGDFVWLSADSALGTRLYAPLGFRTIGVQHAFSRSAA